MPLASRGPGAGWDSAHAEAATEQQQQQQCVCRSTLAQGRASRSGEAHTQVHSRPLLLRRSLSGSWQEAEAASPGERCWAPPKPPSTVLRPRHRSCSNRSAAAGLSEAAERSPARRVPAGRAEFQCFPPCFRARQH